MIFLFIAVMHVQETKVVITLMILDDTALQGPVAQSIVSLTSSLRGQL